MVCYCFNISNRIYYCFDRKKIQLTNVERLTITQIEWIHSIVCALYRCNNVYVLFRFVFFCFLLPITQKTKCKKRKKNKNWMKFNIDQDQKCVWIMFCVFYFRLAWFYLFIFNRRRHHTPNQFNISFWRNFEWNCSRKI